MLPANTIEKKLKHAMINVMQFIRPEMREDKFCPTKKYDIYQHAFFEFNQALTDTIEEATLLLESDKNTNHDLSSLLEHAKILRTRAEALYKIRTDTSIRSYFYDGWDYWALIYNDDENIRGFLSKDNAFVDEMLSNPIQGRGQQPKFINPNGEIVNYCAGITQSENPAYHIGLTSIKGAKENYTQVYSDHLPTLYKIQVNGEEITLGSWNVLEDDQFHGMSMGGWYGETTQQETARHQRIADAIVRMIKRDSLDFFALQEIHPDGELSKVISSKLQEAGLNTYQVVPQRGKVTLYNTEKFQLNANHKYSSETIATAEKLGVGLSAFSSKKTKQIISIGNAHTSYSEDPRGHKQLIQELLNNQKGTQAAIYIGDANCTGGSTITNVSFLAMQIAGVAMQGAHSIDVCYSKITPVKRWFSRKTQDIPEKIITPALTCLNPTTGHPFSDAELQPDLSVLTKRQKAECERPRPFINMGENTPEEQELRLWINIYNLNLTSEERINGEVIPTLNLCGKKSAAIVDLDENTKELLNTKLDLTSQKIQSISPGQEGIRSDIAYFSESTLATLKNLQNTQNNLDKIRTAYENLSLKVRTFLSEKTGAKYDKIRLLMNRAAGADVVGQASPSEIHHLMKNIIMLALQRQNSQLTYRTSSVIHILKQLNSSDCSSLKDFLFPQKENDKKIDEYDLLHFVYGEDLSKSKMSAPKYQHSVLSSVFKGVQHFEDVTQRQAFKKFKF